MSKLPSKSRRRHRSEQFVETLEHRQLLSLTVDLRLPGGGKTATVSEVGQKINLEVWATVKGSNGSTSDDGAQNIHGALLSTNVNGGAANGTLAVALTSPFNALGSSRGTQRDLDGDGDLDVGSNDNSTDIGFFVARAGEMIKGSSFKIGNATFTVTALKSTSGQTNLAYRGREIGTAPVWSEDGQVTRPMAGGIFLNGTPVVLKRSGGTNPPSPPPPPPPPPPTGSSGRISGIVFGDNDKDGALDSGDTRLSNRTIYIDANRNGKLDSGEMSTRSSSSGEYVFSSLAAGTYRIRRADLPTGYKLSVPSTGYHDVTLASNQQVSGKHFGAVPVTSAPPPPPTGSSGRISGMVFGDNDKDGVLDSSDTRLSNRTIYIDANKNGRLDSGERSVKTSSGGEYVLSNLAAGTYRIRRADVPTGYKLSTPSSGYYDVTISSGQQVSGKHFGAVPATTSVGSTGRISGIVFSDKDKDGLLDSSDTRLSNRTIYIDANRNGKLDAGEKSVKTNSGGEYVFSGLAAGSYRIRRADLPTGYKFSTPTSGYYDILLGSNQQVSGRHFGAVPV